jgi:hypothetical protein
MSAGPIYPHFTPEGASPNGALLLNFIGEAIVAAGDTVPSDGGTGYGEGCIFFKNAGSANAQVYINRGTGASCDFDALATSVGGGPVSVADGTAYTVLAANSGKTHVLPDFTSSCTITLPTAAAGLEYTFIGKGVAADAQNWVFDTGSASAFYLCGLTHLDSDDPADATVPVYPDGNSNDIMTIVTPGAGTRIHLVCDGTNWIVNGLVVSATVPTFAD